jgi:hypothetical protein
VSYKTVQVALQCCSCCRPLCRDTHRAAPHARTHARTLTHVRLIEIDRGSGGGGCSRTQEDLTVTKTHTQWLCTTLAGNSCIAIVNEMAGEDELPTTCPSCRSCIRIDESTGEIHRSDNTGRCAMCCQDRPLVNVTRLCAACHIGLRIRVSYEVRLMICATVQLQLLNSRFRMLLSLNHSATTATKSRKYLTQCGGTSQRQTVSEQTRGFVTNDARAKHTGRYAQNPLLKSRCKSGQRVGLAENSGSSKYGDGEVHAESMIRTPDRGQLQNVMKGRGVSSHSLHCPPTVA